MNVYGKCLAKNCTRECQSFKPSDEDTSLCKFCDHHEQQHQLIGMVMNNTSVQISAPPTTAQVTSTAPVAPFIAPKYTSSVAESRNIFGSSARIATSKGSTHEAKVKKGLAKDTHKDLSFAEVYVLPLDAKSVPSSETEKTILAQRGRVWKDYAFGDVDQTRLDFKLRGGVEVAKDYTSGCFFVYLFEGKKKWIATGCSHLRGPTEAEVESCKRDTSSKYKQMKVIITPECWEDDELIFSGSFVDLSREPEVESTAARSTARTATRTDADEHSGSFGGAAVGAPPREPPTRPTDADPTLAAHQSESSRSETAVHRKLTEREQQARELHVPLQAQLLARYESPREREDQIRRNKEAFEAEYGPVAAPPRRSVPSASPRPAQGGESSDVGSRSSLVSATHRSVSGSGKDSRTSTTASVRAPVAPGTTSSSQVAAAPVKKKRKETEKTEETEKPPSSPSSPSRSSSPRGPSSPRSPSRRSPSNPSSSSRQSACRKSAGKERKASFGFILICFV